MKLHSFYDNSLKHLANGVRVSSIILTKGNDARRMDLFNLGMYFGSYVPVRALSNRLLKYSACACAAKQLGQVKGANSTISGFCSHQANMTTWKNPENVDWAWHRAKFYDKAISLLMDALIQDSDEASFSSPKAIEGSLSATTPEELLAATAILCVYEFLDASGAAWSGHLSGTKSLLDIAEVLEIPLTSRSFQSPP